MKFRKPWEECPNCLQKYVEGGCLVAEMATAFVDFAEENYANNIHYNLEALFLKLETFIKGKGSEGYLATGSKMLSLIDQLKEEDPPPSPDGRILFGIEPHIYNSMGIIFMKEANYEEAVRCFQTYRDLSAKAVTSVAMAERNLAIATAKLTRTRVKDIIGSEKMLDSLKTVYDMSWRRGKDSTDTIRHGIDYANGLKKAHRGVEAERLLLELLALSRRVHGPDHKLTIKATQALQKCQKRIIICITVHGPRKYSALGYKGNDSHCLIVRGPIKEPEDKEGTFKTNNYIPVLGTPVVIKGMQHPHAHLNGKVGDIRSLDKKSRCFTVHFEDKSLEPCSVNCKKVGVLSNKALES